MNYRHEFHAGNFADVFKHAVIARILLHLGEKAAPYRVIDTHAGAGLYDLAAEAARRTGEWRDGIGRLMSAELPVAPAALLQPYLQCVSSLNDGVALRRYPGSPLLALTLMRPPDRLIACELEPRAFATLTKNLRGDRRAKAIVIDGWTALGAFIPPKERRGVVVVDPPFEEVDEFPRLVAAIETMHRKWASGIGLLWYPVKDSAPDKFARALIRTGVPRLLRTEVHRGGQQESGRLAGAGLIVVNPPWRLAEELKVLAPALADILFPGQGRGFVGWLTREN